MSSTLNRPREERHGHYVQTMDQTLIVTFDRPKCANALDMETCRALQETFDEFDQSTALLVAIVSGAGRHFCAGMDLNLIKPGQRIELPRSGFGGLTARKTNKPIIAAVNGSALGGGFEIALACDLIIAASSASFALPEPKVGQAALAGGLTRLPLAIGYKRAMEYILTGKRMSAEQARQYGLVNEVTDSDCTIQRAIAVAGDICQCAPLAVRASKAVAQVHDRADHVLKMEQTPPKIVNYMLDSEDAVEGARAFIQKRRPNWRSR